MPRRRLAGYGLAGASVVSYFLPLLPWSLLAGVRGFGRALLPVREALFAKVDRRIASLLAPCDVFVGLSAVAVESAIRARQLGALVLIERGSSHILTQRQTALDADLPPPSDLYVERELASYEAADRIVVLSDFAARSFLKHGVPAERIEVQPLGVSLSRFSAPESPPSLPVRAIFVGGWSRRKGCDLLEGVLRAIPNLTLTHAGMVVDAPLPAGDRFRSLGHLDHERLSQELRRHHLLLFPSRDDGFGMVMAEALASGLRVVASDASGGPDLARVVGAPYVEVVPAGSESALIEATARQVAAIEADLAGLAAPRERIEGLSWRGYGERYDAMLARLTEARR